MHRRCEALDHGSAPRDLVQTAVVEVQQRLRGMVLRRLRGDRQATDDVLQRFALKALERAGELRDSERVHGWLARILASTLADHGREAARRRERVEDPHTLARLADLCAPQEEEAWASCTCVEPLLGALRPDQADLIRRLDLAGEGRAAVAASLGLRANALHVRLHRARRALAALLMAACLTCPTEGFMNCACPVTPQAGDPRRMQGTRRASGNRAPSCGAVPALARAASRATGEATAEAAGQTSRRGARALPER
jgi:RNA polymerase sigma-70 factor (ECF subfamily)